MFNQVYDTIAGRAFSTKEVIRAIQKAQAIDELSPASMTSGRQLPGVFELTPYSKDVPPFHHPLIFEGIHGEALIAIDQRPNMALTREGSSTVKTPYAYDFLALRAWLQRLWLDGKREEMRQLGEIPLRVYTRWLSESIARRLGLQPWDQVALSCFAIYFYLCQFDHWAEVDEEERLKMAVAARNALKIPTEEFLKHTDGLPPLTTLEQFCDAVKQRIENPRLEALVPGFIVTVCSNVWFGNASREVAASALEFPPSFLAMLSASLRDRTMHGAPFSKLVATVAKPNTATDFLRSFTALIGQSNYE